MIGANRASPWKGLPLLYAERVTPAEAALLQKLSILGSRSWLANLFVTVSRLGDGPLWILTAAALLLLGGASGKKAVVAGGLAVVISVAVFKAMKQRVARPRPFEVWTEVPCLLAPPDRFSFPSGHTMTAFAVHAVLHRMIPGSDWFFLPAAVLIGLSRLFLGLHYPTDVLIGSVLGYAIGTATVWALTMPLV